MSLYNKLKELNENEKIALLEKYDKLLEKALYLAALGTPVKPRREFERAISTALEQVQGALLNIKMELNVEFPSINNETKIKFNSLARSYGIRPLWLSLFLEEDND